MIQALLWDLDGVILDSAEEHRLAWHEMARQANLPFTDEDFAHTFGKRNDEIFHQLWPRVSAEEIKRLSHEKEIAYRHEIELKATYLPGAEALLKAAHEQGYKQVIASSAPRENIELIIRVLHLDRYIDGAVSGESVRHGKPAPDIFLSAAETVAIPPEQCVVLEDAVAGVEAALAAGMRCIAVSGARDLPGLKKATIEVHNLTEMSVQRIQQLA